MSPVVRREQVLQGVHYPAPLATHEEVVKDAVVFWDTLRRFHFKINTTKFMVPVIGGKELDLHVLYLEVTRRGGFEKVVAEKKWREVVHFFRTQGPLSTPTPSPSSSEKPGPALVEYSPKGRGAKGTKPVNDCPVSVTDEGTGTIDGKFNCGYLVTVKLGSEILSGVLYHSNQQTLAGPPNPTPSPEPVNAIVPYTSTRSGRVAGSRRRRSRRRTDPNHPKPNRSGYNFFFAETHFKLKSLYPNREREFTKMIGESWNKLPAEERLVYQNIGLQDKARYKRELKEYKESLRLKIQTGHGN
ncbi:hypothetical protein ACFX2B_041812 [Malus domestica]